MPAQRFIISLLTALLLALLAALHASEPDPAEPVIRPAAVDVLTETWRAAEITFESANTYPHPLAAPDLNVVFTSPSGKSYRVPGFWDGGKTWRVRFAPTEYGVWKYVSTCANGGDAGLQGKRGTLGANRYRGPLEIYRHGFIKTAPGVRYFMYADNTPFFYLGDTGNVPMGTLVAIVPTVDVTKLGLSSPMGLAVAHALQDYGAYVVVSGGKNQLTLYAETPAQGMPQITDIKNDLAKMRRYLAAVLNNSPKSVGGGGKPRRPPAPDF